MSEEYLAQQPTAIWNSARGVWEIAGSQNLFCEHWALYQEVWPTSGMTVNGRLYELQTQAHRTTVPESSLLRSPKASEGEGGALGEAEARRRGNTVGVRDQVMDLVASQGEKVTRAVLPTPNTMEHREIKSKEKIAELKAKSPGGYRNLREEVIHELLPTTTASYWKGANNSGGESTSANGLATRIDQIVKSEDQVLTLLMTPVASEGTKAPAQQTSDVKSKTGQVWLSNQAKDMELSWGKFEFAIRQWEAVLGRPAPAPTKPDGKDGAHRLSSEFTEWMMGLEPGWVTGCGLTRNEELKACGNGVVPQQAQLALRILLDGVSW